MRIASACVVESVYSRFHCHKYYAVLIDINLYRYCPQFDALNDLLSGRETLTLYARLRGVHESRVPHVVEALITHMQLTAYADMPSKAYSGGR
jgi:ABC-type multidrug transport system ATPase subunit